MSISTVSSTRPRRRVRDKKGSLYDAEWVRDGHEPENERENTKPVPRLLIKTIEKVVECDVEEEDAEDSEFEATSDEEEEEEEEMHEMECSVCLTRFTDRQLLQEHLVEHGQEKPYKCDVCDKAYWLSEALIRHAKSHTGATPFKCEVCDQAFAKRTTLNHHKATHGVKAYRCEICEKRFTFNHALTYHMRIHTGEKPYHCDLCQMAFTRSDQLHRHKKAFHERDHSFSCRFCGRNFTNASNLTVHIRTHTGEKPYSCDQCDMRFATSSVMKRHKSKHTGEKAYKCMVCGKAYKQHYSLVQHMRVHTGEKPYQCDECDTGFTTKRRLDIHMYKHTGDKPHICGECGHAFIGSHDLMRHKLSHTGVKLYACFICTKRFARTSGLNRHLKHAHEDVKERAGSEITIMASPLLSKFGKDGKLADIVKAAESEANSLDYSKKRKKKKGLDTKEHLAKENKKHKKVEMSFAHIVEPSPATAATPKDEEPEHVHIKIKINMRKAHVIYSDGSENKEEKSSDNGHLTAVDALLDAAAVVDEGDSGNKQSTNLVSSIKSDKDPAAAPITTMVQQQKAPTNTMKIVSASSRDFRMMASPAKKRYTDSMKLPHTPRPRSKSPTITKFPATVTIGNVPSAFAARAVLAKHKTKLASRASNMEFETYNTETVQYVRVLKPTVAETETSVNTTEANCSPHIETYARDATSLPIVERDESLEDIYVTPSDLDVSYSHAGNDLETGNLSPGGTLYSSESKYIIPTTMEYDNAAMNTFTTDNTTDSIAGSLLTSSIASTTLEHSTKPTIYEQPTSSGSNQFSQYYNALTAPKSAMIQNDPNMYYTTPALPAYVTAPPLGLGVGVGVGVPLPAFDTFSFKSSKDGVGSSLSSIDYARHITVAMERTLPTMDIARPMTPGGIKIPVITMEDRRTLSPALLPERSFSPGQSRTSTPADLEYKHSVMTPMVRYDDPPSAM